MVDRMIRATKAEVALYEEVEANPALTTEAYTIVGIVAAVAAVGGVIVGMLSGDPGGAIMNGIWQGVSVFVGYLAWAYLTYFIGTSVFKGTADFGELQRALGYAMSPQVLSFIPCVGLLFSLWSLYLGFVAVRQALDFDNTKALMTAGLAFVVQFVILLLIGGLLGVGSAGLNALTGG